MNFLSGGGENAGNYQIAQSLVGLGNGGLLGVGLGNSMQKLQYLPEPHTDFVFSFVGEELGLAGTLSVICLFAAFAIQGLRIAREAPDAYGFLVATGITAMVSVYSLLNIGVVTGVLPTTGLPLPFISYGGSALLWNLAGVGILMGVARASAVDVKVQRKTR
jgi:cell division protein FtsW